MDKKRFAVAILATKSEFIGGRIDFTAHSIALAIYAENENEARGIAYVVGKEKYPPEKGYDKVDISITEFKE